MTTLFVKFLLTFKGHLIPWSHDGIHGLTNSWLSSFLKIEHNMFIQMVIAPLLNKLLVVFSKVQHQVLCYLVCILMTYFADDTNLLFPAKKLATTESTVNHELKCLSQQLRSNKLKCLIETKTEMIFRSPSKNLPRELDIRIN